MAAYYISARDLIESLWPDDEIALPDSFILDGVKIAPATIAADDRGRTGFKTEVLLDRGFELRLPGIDFAYATLGCRNTPYTVRARVFPDPGVALGPVPLTIHLRSPLLLPARRVSDQHGVKRYERDPSGGFVSIELSACEMGYGTDSGFSLAPRASFSVPVFEVAGTNLFLGMQDVRIVYDAFDVDSALFALGFDDSFRGIWAASGMIYWLPEIRLLGEAMPGLRIDFENVAIGNQGVSLAVDLSWEVAYTDDGHFIAEDTELLGHLLFEDWQIALARVSGAVRRNVPESFAVRSYLRVPFFGAVFCADFSLSYREGADGAGAFGTMLRLAKESADPIVVRFFDDGLVLRVTTFESSGWLSDDGFHIDGRCGFEADIFGFRLSVAESEVAYTHQGSQDEFDFRLRDIRLGELGNVEEAHLKLAAGKSAAGALLIEKLEITAVYAWRDLKALVPQTLRDSLNLPEDGRIDALLTWEEDEAGTGASRRIVVRLKTQAAHLDNLWAFVPPAFRPEVRNMQSMFKITYDSSTAFAAADAAGNPLPPPADADRAGVEVELSALMEIRLPDPAAFDLPNFELLRISTGDGEGFVGAEFKAQFSVQGEDEAFQGGFTIQNPFTVELMLPGMDPDAPFVHNAMTRIGLQFEAAEDDAGENQIGGRIFCEGEFELRPLVPAAFPFASALNALLRNVGLDQIKGRSRLTIDFTRDTFDFQVAGEFDKFGVEIDVFEMMSALAGPAAAPSKEIDIDFDVGFQLVGFSFCVGNGSRLGPNPDKELQFEFRLAVECAMTGLPPLTAALTLGGQEFSFGLENVRIPIEIPRYPIDNADLARLRAGTQTVWTPPASQSYAAELDAAIAAIDTRLDSAELFEAERFRFMRDKAALELKKLFLQIVMAIHGRLGSGHEMFQALVEADTWLHATCLNFLHVETGLTLEFPEIKLRVPFDNPSGIELAGSGRLTGFAEGDPLRGLENYIFSLGLSSQYIFARIESDASPIAIPAFGTPYDDGSVSISRFVVGYGYTKNSFAMDFAGELVVPSQLREDMDTSRRAGVGVRVPLHNKLAFKLDLIPVTIGKVTLVIPLPQFDLDLRSPNAPGLAATDVCRPYWDGFEVNVPGGLHMAIKQMAFSPFFGFAIIPNLRFSGDVDFGNAENGLTLIVDDLLVLLGIFNGGYGIVPIPFLASPNEPYFRNICVNLRAAGFMLNFDLQRPFPSASPMALIEAFGLISDPMMPVDPAGSLANTIRFTLSDAYLRAPDYALAMFPDLARIADRKYDFSLNLGTLINAAQSIAATGEPLVQALERVLNGQRNLAQALGALPRSFDPWKLVALLPPEMRKFRTGGQVAGFSGSACLVFATEAEARAGLENKNARRKKLPAAVIDRTDADLAFSVYEKEDASLFEPTRDGDLSTHWRAEGDAPDGWASNASGIARSGSVSGVSYLLYEGPEEPTDFGLSVALTLPRTIAVGGSAGIVFCHDPSNGHYALKLLRASDASGLEISIERMRDGDGVRLGRRPLAGRAGEAVRLELISYLERGERQFIVFEMQHTARRSRSAEADEGRAREILRTRETGPLQGGKFGLYTSREGVKFADMAVHRLRMKQASFGRVSAASIEDGFDVQAPDTRLGRSRMIEHDESSVLFKGIEFRRFSPQDLDGIPLDRIHSADSSRAGIYMGARLKIFTGQRFRFLGRVFSDGAFAFISEAEVRPLRLTVLGVPVQLPFEGYGRLLLVGRQKRGGYYGHVEAAGYVDWAAVPGVLRVTAGSSEKPVLLKLHSDGRFALRAPGAVKLFNGTVVIDGEIDVSHEHCFARGNLRYAMADFVALNIKGSGRVGPATNYAFSGSGQVTLFGRLLSNVDVALDRNWARFATSLSLSPGDWPASLAVLDNCSLDMEVQGRVNVQRVTRPEFQMEGRGSIGAFGASIAGRGGIRSVVATNATKDFFEAYMEGNLHWQGRKWLGGELRIGSRGFEIRGSTNFGLKLTPKAVPGTTLNVAHLFLSLQLDGEFSIDATGRVKFSFRGHWTLGVALPGSGGDGSRQVLPVASQKLQFSSSTGAIAGLYERELFKIQGLSFIPVGDVQIPVPTVQAVIKEGREAFLKAGTQKLAGVNTPSIEFKVGGERLGLRGIVPYWDDNSSWQSSQDVFGVHDYEFSLDTDTVRIDFDQIKDLSISMALRDDASKNYPIVLRIKSPGGTNEYSL